MASTHTGELSTWLQSTQEFDTQDHEQLRAFLHCCKRAPHSWLQPTVETGCIRASHPWPQPTVETGYIRAHPLLQPTRRCRHRTTSTSYLQPVHVKELHFYGAFH
ncbi:hypothetical protein DUNSADRAFT_3141 [Dunaliella salina]|uniref:Encoded protein n=1 Tax=Dunaliella salina TaxID=3046 RepID=A0ABQ7H841_DUNSA|nr:hypothetical protein DUNSADRAFT_3141 [Dunaliella salina]|eukprot:KAF5843012.1 hypothetical protein DUNSADRAFT_3141 [Dunaliella salina]